MAKSFYDLDYLIEINEKAAEKYTKAYEDIQGKYAIIIVIYSAIAIFVIPLIQHLSDYNNINKFYIFSFILFLSLFLISIFFTVKLILPTVTELPSDPKEFSDNVRVQYENLLQSNFATAIDPLIKASYINDLQTVIDTNKAAYIRKRSFFFYGLTFALISVMPFLFCLGVHLGKNDDTIYKVKLVDSSNISNLHKK